MWKKANRLQSTTFLSCFYEIFFAKTTDFSFFIPEFRFSEKKRLDLFLWIDIFRKKAGKARTYI